MTAAARRRREKGAGPSSFRAADPFAELLGRYLSLQREYSAYKERNESLKAAQKRFYSLLNHTRDGIYTYHLAIHKYVYTNPAFIDMFGQPCKDIVTTDSAIHRILPKDREKFRNKISPASLRNATGDEIEYRCVASDGSIRWMHDRWVIIRDRGGEPRAIEGIVRDISEMKTIIGIKDHLVGIFESCMDAIVVTDARGTVTQVNKGAETLFHTPRKSFVGRFIGDTIGNQLDGYEDVFQLILSHAPTSNYELEARLANGLVIPLLISFSFLEDGENKPIGTIIYIRDISARKETEQRIHTLSRQLIRTQEIERSRIARDLHDHLAQDLYSINIRLKTFLAGLDSPPDGCDDQVQALMASLQDTINNVRKMVFNIHPTGMDTLGLVNILNGLCRNVSKLSGLRVDFKSAGMDHLKTDFELNSAIYRLLQEALNNIQKHAGACNVVVRLVFSHPDIILRIDDDGKGFDGQRHLEQSARKGCMGIWSMRERVGLLNGRMTIDSQPRNGTHIFVEIPYFQCDRDEKQFA